VELLQFADVTVNPCFIGSEKGLGRVLKRSLLEISVNDVDLTHGRIQQGWCKED
jgi:hypothetical protein